MKENLVKARDMEKGFPTEVMVRLKAVIGFGVNYNPNKYLYFTRGGKGGRWFDRLTKDE